MSIWTADTGRAVRLARTIISGAVFANAVVASDPRLPFGGTKRSGHGRRRHRRVHHHPHVLGRRRVIDRVSRTRPWPVRTTAERRRRGS
ncbi:aldehyde dehydrogenase family protein [Lentzea xinjiangensis]|uniref:aldehyde dehydrogenase family protein n=1 Tax=Lentzea xinjiangensis TaxID=402600 RepID=UPI001C42EFEF